MSEWAQKRFWSSADAIDTRNGFTVHLDGRAIKTPAKAALVVPTRALAMAIAAEWNDQGDKIDPRTMPATRTANAAIDKVKPQFSEVAEMVAAYGDTDLLCYRATEPQELVARQKAAWDPFLRWAQTDLGVTLSPIPGLLHRPQSPEALAELGRLTFALSDFELAAFHDLVGISGSLILGFAATVNRWTGTALFEISQLDEIWQQEQWGSDEDAVAATKVKLTAFLDAKRFYELCRQNDK
ncbi:MAG: ATP12 family protein [Paracoccaceae bacterium]